LAAVAEDENNGWNCEREHEGPEREEEDVELKAARACVPFIDVDHSESQCA
jgi:hypothetical protein